MPFDGSGNFSRVHNWQSDRDNNIKILASRMDEEFDNFASGMNVVFFRSGMVPMSGTLMMGSNYITGLVSGSEGAPSVRFADDANTGFFLNGLNDFRIVTNGITRVSITNAGLAVTGNITATGNATITGTLNVTGDVTFGTVNATTFKPDTLGSFTVTGGNPFLNFDAGDYIAYDRTTDVHSHAVGGTVRFAVSATGAAVTGALTATGDITGLSHMLDANGYYKLVGGNPVVNGDSTDYYMYDRANNRHDFFVASTRMLSVRGDGVVEALFKAKAPLFEIDASYYLNMFGGSPSINFDANDLIYYDRNTNAMVLYLNGSFAFIAGTSSISWMGKPVATDGMSRASTKIYDSTAAPSGGADGDLWFQYV